MNAAGNRTAEGGIAAKNNLEFFSFWIDDKLYAIPMRLVVSTLNEVALDKNCDCKNCVKKRLLIQDSEIPVIDLRRNPRVDERGNEGGHVVVISANYVMSAYIVDGWGDAFDIDEKEILMLDEDVRGANNEYIYGVSRQDQYIVHHMDIEKYWADLAGSDYSIGS